MLGKKNNILSRKSITIILLTVSSDNFQFVSATHELNALPLQFTLKPTPIATDAPLLALTAVRGASKRGHGKHETVMQNPGSNKPTAQI